LNLDVAYIPTPKNIVREMLKLAGVRRGEQVYDLGAGDGRILIEATRRFGARSVGIEIDPERVSRINERLKSTGVEAEVIQADFMNIDLSHADVVTIYLSDTVNAKLAPKLARELKQGTRIVSLDYVLPGWKVEKESKVESGGVTRNIYLYRVFNTQNLHGNIHN
jgi:16S rRNA A1518/A1519 N6-dimethyltransferase RsmA/KsgA/DIM1 with predicted DNA glycosylase/AP lyase activity